MGSRRRRGVLPDSRDLTAAPTNPVGRAGLLYRRWCIGKRDRGHCSRYTHAELRRLRIRLLMDTDDIPLGQRRASIRRLTDAGHGLVSGEFASNENGNVLRYSYSGSDDSPEIIMTTGNK